MRHRGSDGSSAGSVGALAVAVIQSAFVTGLVAPPGGPTGAPTGLLPTEVLTVPLPPVAAAAEVEDRPAKSAPDLTIAVVHDVRPEANARESLTTGECGGRLNSNVGARKMSTRGPGRARPGSPLFCRSRPESYRNRRGLRGALRGHGRVRNARKSEAVHKLPSTHQRSQSMWPSSSSRICRASRMRSMTPCRRQELK